jgi:hypothetical protein
MKTVFIIGSGDSGWGFQDLAFEETEVWGCNNMAIKHPSVPWTRIFEVHSFSKKGDTWLRKGQEMFRDIKVNDYIAKLNALGVPIYILEHPENPFTNSVAIDLPTLRSTYRDFFSTTLSYQLALALEEGFTHIELLGVDMTLSSEYRDQRPSVTYFIGLAEGRGITVNVAPDSPIVHNDYAYGYGVSSLTLWDQRVNMLHAYNQKEIQKYQDLINQHIGAEKCLETMIEFYTTLQKGYKL